jgi:hypothetical protein
MALDDKALLLGGAMIPMALATVLAVLLPVLSVGLLELAVTLSSRLSSSISSSHGRTPCVALSPSPLVRWR